VADIPKPDKIDKIIELLGDLNDEEKDRLVEQLVGQEELLTKLLDELIQQNVDAGGETEDMQGYINFLRRVKE
jgi:hypothetical protein